VARRREASLCWNLCLRLVCCASISGGQAKACWLALYLNPEGPGYVFSVPLLLPQPNTELMDPSRSTKRPRRAPSADSHSRPLRPSTTSHHAQPSLPSIRHLHPYLPPSAMSQQQQQQQHPPDSSSPYSYPPPQQPAYATSSSATQMHLAHQDPSALPMSSAQMQSDRRGESEHDGDEQPGPPKKKRRRQALSCTG
jgi:hypothetical protein